MIMDEAPFPISMPKTAKGSRTREHIKKVSRHVFGDVGYRDARIADITIKANIASGTLYRYFNGKQDILIELLQDLMDEVLAEARESWDPDNPLRSVQATTEKYLRFYERNADLYALLVDGAQHQSDIEELWAQARGTFYARIERMLQRARVQGLLHPDVDPHAIAPLLGGMTEYHAYLDFVLGRGNGNPIPKVAEQVVAIWAHGVFILDDHERREP